MDFEPLYVTYWSALAAYVNDNPGLSSPHLIACPPEYSSQGRKLFIVGQQTNGWCKELQPLATHITQIRKLVGEYSEFSMGKNRAVSPFWQFVRKLERSLDVSTGQIIWGNLNRADENGKRPAFQREVDLHRLFPVLPMEIKLADPDVVVFLTGPDFDKNILFNFPGAEITPTDGDAIPVARVKHPALPMRTFRTYHPQYLRRVRRFDTALSALVESIRAE